VSHRIPPRRLDRGQFTVHHLLLPCYHYCVPVPPTVLYVDTKGRIVRLPTYLWTSRCTSCTSRTKVQYVLVARKSRRSRNPPPLRGTVAQEWNSRPGRAGERKHRGLSDPAGDITDGDPQIDKSQTSRRIPRSWRGQLQWEAVPVAKSCCFPASPRFPAYPPFDLPYT
jgi:hypothetical protein